MMAFSYDPAAHPRQISLLDANGQPIAYMLTPIHANTMQNASNTNGCCICHSPAVVKCSFGISRGNPCGRLLCLAHNMELSGGNGGRYPHCPEHFQHIQQNKCCIM